MIGGIVGGVIALFLIVGVTAFIVTRRNRQRTPASNQQRTPASNQNDISMAQASLSDYGKLTIHPAYDYGDVSDVRKTTVNP